MFKIEAVATVYYTCSLSEEDFQKVINYIKENPRKFEFMSDKDKIIEAVGILASDCEIELYGNATESDFITDEIKWSTFEERTAEEILGE